MNRSNKTFANDIGLFQGLRDFLGPYVNDSSEILEVGAGPANKATRYLASVGGRVTSIDVDPRVVSNELLDKGVVYDGREFPFEDGSFDVVFSHAVMEHIEDPIRLVGECHRVLRPGGAFISIQPNVHSPLIFFGESDPEQYETPPALAGSRKKDVNGTLSHLLSFQQHPGRICHSQGLRFCTDLCGNTGGIASVPFWKSVTAETGDPVSANTEWEGKPDGLP